MRIDINIHEHEEALRGIVYTLMEEVIVVYGATGCCAYPRALSLMARRYQ
jgi:hypothetical protein